LGEQPHSSTPTSLPVRTKTRCLAPATAGWRPRLLRFVGGDARKEAERLPSVFLLIGS
jgi:hypothetical protein